MNYTRFANARVAASSVAALLGDKKRKLTLRPWNQYKPDQATWWIVPGTAWPAVSGKIKGMNWGCGRFLGLFMQPIPNFA